MPSPDRRKRRRSSSSSSSSSSPRLPRPRKRKRSRSPSNTSSSSSETSSSSSSGKCESQVQLLFRNIRRGHVREVRRKLDLLRHASVHVTKLRSAAGGTCLYEAALHSQIELVSYLLHNSATAHTPQGPYRRTPLHAAALAQDPCIDLVRLLLQEGADPNARDEDKNTAMHYALMAEEPNLELLYQLYYAGTDPNLVNVYGESSNSLDLNFFLEQYWDKHDPPEERKREGDGQHSAERDAKAFSKFCALVPAVLKGRRPKLQIEEVPWPSGPEENPFAIPSDLDAKAKSRLIRRLQLKWHPDKFNQRFGLVFETASLYEVKRNVSELSKILNAFKDFVPS